MLYNISHSQQWGELQRFLVPKLSQLRALCQTQSIQKPGTGDWDRGGAFCMRWGETFLVQMVLGTEGGGERGGL